MQQAQLNLRSDKPKIEPFEFQNWEVYRKSLLLTKHMYAIARELDKNQDAQLADQLKRASTSIVLNLAEGVSRYGLREKMNFWRISKGSLFECVAILDVIETVSGVYATPEELKLEMQTIGKMLSGLLRWAEKQKT